MSEYPKVHDGIFDTVKSNTEQFLEIVGQYFPEAIKDGEVDFTALKEEMGEFQEVKGEHYDFTWAGKQEAKKEAQADIYGRTLKFKPQDSVNADTTENIYIEGDNLEALKLLKKNYYGKIKMIYIVIWSPELYKNNMVTHSFPCLLSSYLLRNVKIAQREL